MEEQSKPILIKRYASRRLYNTETSDYVTLDEVAEFIRDGKDIQIIDRKSGEDITRQYLLQIIADQESRGESVLPVNVLTDIVRSYSDNAENMIPAFLAQSFQLLKEQQSKFIGGLQQNGMAAFDPMRPMEGWQKMQSDFLGKMMGSLVPTQSDYEAEDETAEDKDVSAEREAELAAIKKQLTELQDKLKDL